jgi:hypothetical protein
MILHPSLQYGIREERAIEMVFLALAESSPA